LADAPHVTRQSTGPIDAAIHMGMRVTGHRIATFSCYRFAGARSMAWAFAQMQFAKAPLRRVPGIGFAKLFGSGTGESFHPVPNPQVYAIMATWPSLEQAKAQLAECAVFARYRDRAAESLTVYLGAEQASGLWDGVEPFAARKSEAKARPIGVLTRATIRTRRVFEFWRSVPNISESIASSDGVLFKLGVGEIPWLHQVTFSIWRDPKAISAFAYQSGPHREAIKHARARGWFKEELFARFSILDCEGRWDGAPIPLDGATIDGSEGIAA